MSTEALTPREKEVARMQARGSRNKDIAAELGLSLKTVNMHLVSAYAKLGVKRRAEFVRVADQIGLNATN